MKNKYNKKAKRPVLHIQAVFRSYKLGLEWYQKQMWTLHNEAPCKIFFQPFPNNRNELVITQGLLGTFVSPPSINVEPYIEKGGNYWLCRKKNSEKSWKPADLRRFSLAWRTNEIFLKIFFFDLKPLYLGQILTDWALVFCKHPHFLSVKGFCNKKVWS